jgi:hypothetical protein
MSDVLDFIRYERAQQKPLTRIPHAQPKKNAANEKAKNRPPTKKGISPISALVANHRKLIGLIPVFGKFCAALD